MLKNSALIVTALTAASAGMVLGLSSLSFGGSEEVATATSSVDWQPPSLDALGLGDGWAEQAGLETAARRLRNSAPGSMPEVVRPRDAVAIAREGEVVGWVVPDQSRVQAMMAWELEEAKNVLAERARLAARPATTTPTHRATVTTTTKRLLHDDPRLRLINRPFTRTTYRKPAWLEAWGRTLDRMDDRRADHRRVR